jgi:hypothetical protein
MPDFTGNRVEMRIKRILTASLALLLVAPGAALAGHGKAGLWTITTSMNMAEMPQMPPEVAAMMKQRGMKMPGMGEPITSQICMTQEEVDSDVPPRFSNRAEDCQTHVISKTATSMSADMVCSGRMQGTGHLQISYSSAEHYQGSYSFRGNMEGQPNAMSSSFKGDWVKADCGSIKPFVRKPQ